MYQEYDFVIVGAGSAGCVLANRLSEIKSWNILLIEAGDEELFIMDVPILATMLQFTNNNWGYRTEPQVFNSIYINNNRIGTKYEYASDIVVKYI